MPSPDRAPFNPVLFEPVTDDGAARGRWHAAYKPPPWPWRVAVPLIAGLSLALWAGLVGMFRVLGAG